MFWWKVSQSTAYICEKHLFIIARKFFYISEKFFFFIKSVPKRSSYLWEIFFIFAKTFFLKNKCPKAQLYKKLFFSIEKCLEAQQ